MSSLSSAHAKRSRAHQQFEGIARDLEVLGDAKSYAIVKDTDPSTGSCRFRFGDVPAMPGDLELRIGEMLHNYRCALDHLIWQLVVSEGNTPCERNEFPIFNNAKKYETAKRGRLCGLSAVAISVVDRLQPFASIPPNDFWWHLWYLHQLSNADKHRQLVLTGRHLAKLALNWSSAGTVQPPLIPRISGQVGSDEEIVSVVPTAGMNDLALRPRILVCFDDPPTDVSADLPVHNIISLIDMAVQEAFARLTGFLR